MTAAPGDIGLTQISGDVGKAIRFGQWLDGTGFSNYEHAFIYLGDGQLIVEAEPGGARIAFVTEYDPAGIFWSTDHYPLTADQRSAIVKAALSYVGMPYSALDYFALAAHRLRVPVPGLQRYIGDTGHQICSQLCDQAWRDAGIQLFSDGRWPGYVTPGDLYDRFTATT